MKKTTKSVYSWMETEAGKNILAQINDLMKTAKTPSIHKPKAEVVSLYSVSAQRRRTCDAFNKRFTQLAIDMYPTCTKTERAEKIAKKVNLSPATVMRYMNKNSHTISRPDNLVVIAKKMATSTDFLLGKNK